MPRKHPKYGEDCIGAILYQELYPPDPERFPRGRKPWKAIGQDGRDRFNEAAEVVALHVLNGLIAEVDRSIPLIDYGELYDFSNQDILRWLMRVRDHIEETGEVPGTE